MEISSQLPDMVDQYIVARDQRLVLERQVAEMEKLEKVLKDAIIAKAKHEGLTAVGAKQGLVKINSLIEPRADDWPSVYAYIKENDAFDLLHRRLTSDAVKARWENGVEIPGVGKAEVWKLSVSHNPKE